ncbi:hypothetical protein BUALT_Bualt05G0153800 [Buddleja alternifolia]|uniref:TORTIFOLIA1/SINE1-2 N-terminal domain-containing protein n=1 Tax=Buddleja alternifolia TaxID=168488 RepID=A0AAV6XJD4_9LAMI|nr:hypothetical protein BUALT_Bualt05G0153800 [Buddleja alternifolia]
MTLTKQLSGDFKTRVNTCLNKLLDRDTLLVATYELETIARTLSSDVFAPFLTCLSSTDLSEKPSLRRHSVRLLSILSAAHRDALSPHLPRMIAAVLRRLRDPDSAVRAACVDAVTSIASHVTSPPFSSILNPFLDVLFHEQFVHAQLGTSLCLAAALEAAPVVDATEIRRVLPRVLKLVKSDCFKAKAALLMFIGSVVDCVRSTKNSLGYLFSTVKGFLSSEDWAARKAAAEVLEKVAVAERGFAAEFKVQCLAALESRRFDKVKIVRETMNRALEIWRDVPGLTEEALSPKDTSNNVFVTPQSTRKITRNRSSVSSSSSTTSGTQSSEDKKPCNSSLIKPDLKKNSRSCVVPLNCDDDFNLDDEVVTTNHDFRGKKEFEDLSSIRKQLLQIEDQQSSLMELLQRFIGSTQQGMSLLEKRVDGLEKVLNEISHGMTISTKRISCSGSEIHVV